MGEPEVDPFRKGERMGTPYRMLLVEDDRNLAVAIRMALPADRWEVHVAPQLGDALQALRVLPAPDVIVTELALFEGPPVAHLFEELARTPALASIPVVAVSGWERALEVAAFYGIPAERVLPKPLDLRHLAAVLDASVGPVPGLKAPHRVPVSADVPHRTGADY